MRGYVVSWEESHSLAARARKADLMEVGGILIGRGFRLFLRFVRNRARRICHLHLSAGERNGAVESERRRGRRWMGYFHSHPIGEAIPGESDIAGLEGRLLLIYDVCGEEMRLWKVGSTLRKTLRQERPIRVAPSP